MKKRVTNRRRWRKRKRRSRRSSSSSESLGERQKSTGSEISMKRAGFNVMASKHACNGFYWWYSPPIIEGKHETFAVRDGPGILKTRRVALHQRVSCLQTANDVWGGIRDFGLISFIWMVFPGKRGEKRREKDPDFSSWKQPLQSGSDWVLLWLH